MIVLNQTCHASLAYDFASAKAVSKSEYPCGALTNAMSSQRIPKSIVWSEKYRNAVV